VVRVINFFRDNQTVYMVMEYAQGMSLVKEIQNNIMMPERRIRLIFATLIGGLREVHAHKLLHLDIKPANIYIHKDGSPLLLDFGAARQTLLRKDRYFVPMLTPGYASPEQHDRDYSLGPWSDIYGIGATIYACINGSSPPCAADRIKKDNLVPAQIAFRGVYSSELLQLIDQCLAIKIDQRPHSLREIQQALLNKKYYREGNTISKNINTKIYKFKRWFNSKFHKKGKKL
jgi:serine/threonine protein kinase